MSVEFAVDHGVLVDQPPFERGLVVISVHVVGVWPAISARKYRKTTVKPKFPLKKTSFKTSHLRNTHVEMLDRDIVSESVRPELRLACSESRRDTGL